jgi:hypothetical protein
MAPSAMSGAPPSQPDGENVGNVPEGGIGSGHESPDHEKQSPKSERNGEVKEIEELADNANSADAQDTEVHRESRAGTTLGNVEKRKKDASCRGNEDGPVRKKSRIFRVVEQEKDASDQDVEVSCPKKVKVKKREREKHKQELGRKETGEVSKANSKNQKENLKRGDGHAKPRRVSSTSALRTRADSDSEHDCSSARSEDAPSHVEPGSARAELTGMLIESMATSRASSLPVSSLCRSVLQSRPALVSQRSEREWLGVFERVLEEGRRSCGVFGKVESSGKVGCFFLPASQHRVTR